MIKLEHLVLASPEQMEFIIEGMRNPMNSWEKSDSYILYADRDGGDSDEFILEDDDHSLMQRLAKAGTDHRKFMRMMPVYVRITAPLYWWKEFETYKVGTVSNSCSTMHKIQAKAFTLEDFSIEHLLTNAPVELELYTMNHCAPVSDGEIQWTPFTGMLNTIATLNQYRKRYLDSKEKEDWWQMIQLLPSSYNQTRNVMMNYEVLANIYKSRKNHKLDEWQAFCKWIEQLPYSEIITGQEAK